MCSVTKGSHGSVTGDVMHFSWTEFTIGLGFGDILPYLSRDELGKRLEERLRVPARQPARGAPQPPHPAPAVPRRSALRGL